MQEAIVHLKNADPVIRGIIERVGPCRIEYHEPTFQTLVRSIIYQQLHGKAALTIFTRLMAAAGENPLTPDAVLKLRAARMRSLGVSPQKTAYIRELARMTRARSVDFEECKRLPDDEVIAHLTQVKGIGVWTVHMFLIFALRRPDVLPTGDFGVRMAMKNAYSLADLPKPAEMQQIARPWRPYCSVASWYLWRSLENQAAL